MKTPGAEDHRADIRARPHAVSGRSSTARGRYEFACFFCTAEICRLSPPCTTRSTHPVCGADAGQKIWPDLRCESEARQGGGGDWSLAAPEQIFAGMPWRAYRQCGGETSREHLFFPESYGEYDDGPACPCSCRTAEKFCRNIQTSCSGASAAPEKTTPVERVHVNSLPPFRLHADNPHGEFRHAHVVHENSKIPRIRTVSSYKQNIVNMRRSL